MSVRQGLMALLAEEPMYGARLRSEFEARTGGTWPLNVGQVYTTLARLERDGLVEPLGGSTGRPAASSASSERGEPGASSGSNGSSGSSERADDEGRIAYRLTPTGEVAAAAWWTTPVARDDTPRDELVIKLALAVTSPGVDVTAVVQAQRTATLRHLRDLTRLKARAGEGDERPDLAWALVLENLLFTAEAEARWLDHVESRLAREASERPPAGGSRSVAVDSAPEPSRGSRR